MPDDERPRRRLGDETKNRIADLASGWSLDEPDEAPPPPVTKPAHTPAPPIAKPAHTPTPRPSPPAAERSKPVTTSPAERSKPVTTPPADRSKPVTALPPAVPARAKPRTNPPPPPGSAARKALEDKIVEAARPAGVKTSTSANPVSGEARAVPPSTPPPASSDDAPRSGRQFKRADYAGPQAPFATEPHTPPVIVDESITIDIPAPAVVAPSKPMAAPVPAKPLASASSAPVPARPLSSASSSPVPARPLSSASSSPVPAKPLSSASSSPVPAKPLAPALPLPAPAPSGPRFAVPVGEFDSGVQTLEQETMKRDAAEALLDIPDKVTPVEDLLEDEPPQRGDATTIDPMTAKFERGDPTTIGGPDATEIGTGGDRTRLPSGGTLRPSAALRRKRGLAGDVRYVFTALFGVRASRRELAALEHRQGLRQTSRRRHLVTLGRAAVITDAFDHPALGKAREQLQAIEDERSKHAGAVAASDAELERVRRDRAAKATQYTTDLAACDGELAELAKKLEPLEKEAAVAKKRGQELRESLQRIAKKMAETEALLSSVKAEKMDKAQIQADIATYKADRQSVLRDEPVLAAELDALMPRIAAIEASRAELRRKRTELEKAEVDDQRRTSELLEAIGAKRKVVERAAADAETARDAALFELGDQLYVDRPAALAAQLSPIDQIDLELGEGDRRMMELKEIISNVDKAKLARGAAISLLALAAVVLLVAWLVYLLV